jgi:hypothetical protein
MNMFQSLIVYEYNSFVFVIDVELGRKRMPSFFVFVTAKAHTTRITGVATHLQGFSCF